MVEAAEAGDCVSRDIQKGKLRIGSEPLSGNVLWEDKRPIPAACPGAQDLACPPRGLSPPPSCP